jgi:hypothetical protein
MRNRIGRAQTPVACCATAPYRDSPSGASWDITIRTSSLTRVSRNSSLRILPSLGEFTPRECHYAAQTPVACCATAPYRDSPSGASWDWSDSPSRSFRTSSLTRVSRNSSLRILPSLGEFTPRECHYAWLLGVVPSRRSYAVPHEQNPVSKASSLNRYVPALMSRICDRP